MAGYSKYSRAPGDSILALLEPGEYVLNRNAVNEIGKENLDEINFEDIPRFDMSQRQIGGMLGESLGIPGMTHGGYHGPDYGGYQAPETDYESTYEFYGMAPKFGEQRDKFERQFEFDESRLDPAFQQYRAVMETGREAAGVEAGQARQSAGQMGRGFAGAGTRGTAVQKSQESLYDAYEEQRREAQSTLGQQIRKEKEDLLKARGTALTALEEAEGTIGYGWNAPTPWGEQIHDSGSSTIIENLQAQTAAGTGGYAGVPTGNLQPPANPTHGQTWSVPGTGQTIYWNNNTGQWQPSQP
jgi:hypothetical protein